MSIRIWATVIDRAVAGVAPRAGTLVVGSWVGVDVAASVKEAGVGVAVAGVDTGVPRGCCVGMTAVGDGVMELDSPVAETASGLPPESLPGLSRPPRP